MAAGYGDVSESGTGVLLHTGGSRSASVWAVCLFLKLTPGGSGASCLVCCASVLNMICRVILK